MPNIISVPHFPNKKIAANLCGIKKCDYALEQPWLNSAVKTLTPIAAAVKEPIDIYDLLVTSIVWSYDQAKIFGAPHPLTLKAWGYLRVLDKLTGSHDVDEETSLLTVLDID